ncbi:MAG: NADPH-dependent F420 reductase [Ignavibacteriales bacterium]
MDLMIIGTGKMAEAIATRALSGGHNVTISGRNKTKADELSSSLSSAAAKGATVKSAPFGGQITGDVVVLAVPYSAAIPIVRDLSTTISGKILVDITNPLNSSYNGLVTPPDSSAAEEIAKVIPSGTKIVKAFNTVFAGTIKKGEVGGQPLDVFIAGDDSDAKNMIRRLIESGKMRPIDAGPLQRSRELEALAFLIISLQSTMGTNFMSAVKILS